MTAATAVPVRHGMPVHAARPAHRTGGSYPIRAASYITLRIPSSSRALEKYPPIWSAFERGLPAIVLVHIGLIGAAG